MTLPIKNPDLHKRAFTHRSHLNESEQPNLKSNERLEFLGDAVLELATTVFLFHKYPDKPEGELTSIRSSLVKTQTLAETATELKLGEQLYMSKGEEAGGGRANKNILADTFEAVLGAMYLDQGFEACVEFLQANLFHKVEEIVANNLHRDFKTTFQELVQSKGQPTPYYQVLDEQGPDHDKVFTVGLYVDGEQVSTGRGKSKQLAHQQAAKAALEKLDTTEVV